MSAEWPVISVGELRELIVSGTTVRLLDVRWSLQQPDGREDHRAGHIPGAVYVDMDTELASHGAPSEGRHPLPTPEAFHEAVRGWGINTGDVIVAYDSGTGVAASRAWWLLRHSGLRSIHILDGGLAAWREAGGELESGDVHADPGNVELSWGHMPVIGIDEAAALPEHGLLVDVRAPERYRGEVEPMDPVAGHIPGAINAPNTDNLDSRGRFLPASEIRRRHLELGLGERPAAVYCGSGVNAAHAVAALELAGITVALYPGSWSQWSNTPGRPVATVTD